ncbi:MAG: adenosylhomocysteinase [archaeon]
MPSKVKDPALADQGRLKIEWAKTRMPVLEHLREKYEDEQPLRGIRIAGCLHVTKETAVLVELLRAAGAETVWSGCNPLSTQDDVAAALANDGIDVYAWRGLAADEYYWCIDQTIEAKPDLTLDDGADLTIRFHEKYPKLIARVMGGTEETTTGVMRLRAMAETGALKYPIIAVNDAETKSDFDNIYGTGQSSLDGIMRTTNILFAGKTVVVAGYGHCGKGIAMRARGLGSDVIVCEVDPMKALKAAMDGYSVMKMIRAAPLGDMFITATGCKDVITEEHMKLMKAGALLCNAGHFNVEVSVADLERIAMSKREIRPGNVEYTFSEGKKVYLLAEGRLINLAAAEGHPSEVMDMSFANQFLSLVYLTRHHKSLDAAVHSIPRAQDSEVAQIKLRTTGIEIDELTVAQKKYLTGYKEGT